jgi:hypothetical protein
MVRHLVLLLAATMCTGASPPGRIGSNEISVGTRSLSCTARDGRRVRFVSNPASSEWARAYLGSGGTAFVEVGAPVLLREGEKVAMWAIAHECGHHWLPSRLNTERRVDCLAARRVATLLGRFTREDASAFASALSTSKESAAGHLRGADRVHIVLRCGGAPLPATSEA